MNTQAHLWKMARVVDDLIAQADALDRKVKQMRSDAVELSSLLAQAWEDAADEATPSATLTVREAP